MVSVKSKVEPESSLPMEDVSTPGLTSIEEIAEFLKVDPVRTLKVVLYTADNELVMAVIRGDLEINEIKLKKILHGAELRLATESEIASAGLVAGFVSPIGVSGKVKIIGDDSIMARVNYVAGGNKKDVHYKNVNYLRDFKVDILQDIARAKAGEGCPLCQGVLSSTRVSR
jgi:prolyl-tRNA synthetase